MKVMKKTMSKPGMMSPKPAMPGRSVTPSKPMAPKPAMTKMVAKKTAGRGR